MAENLTFLGLHAKCFLNLSMLVNLSVVESFSNLLRFHNTQVFTV